MNTSLALFAASAALRIGLWAGVAPVLAGDEHGYWRRALGFGGILEALAAGRWPGAEPLDEAYGRGLWPPLHPLLLGLFAAWPGGGVRGARLATALLSAATTPVVYRLTRDVAGRRAAAAAAALHAVYPSFLAYSQLLWSETTYVLVLLLTLCAAVRLSRPLSLRRAAGLGALCGFGLGACALARVSGAPYLLVVPAWLLLATPGRRCRAMAAGLALATGLLTLAPWQAALAAREGRLLPLTTASGYNLLLHNGPFADKEAVRDAIRRSAREHGLHRDAAARALAFAAIAERPAEFLSRCAERLRRVWNADSYVLRHLLRVLIPPPPSAVFYPVFGWLLLSWLGLLGLAALGAVAPGIARNHAALLLGLALVGSALPALAIGNSRMGVPLLALLLPFAGHGAARLAESRVGRAAAIAAGAAAAAALLNTATLAPPFALPEVASSYFRRELGTLDALLGRRSGYADCLGIRTRNPDVLTLELADASYRFSQTDTPRFRWATDGRGSQKLDAYAREPAGPLRLWLHSEARGQQVSLAPIRRELWNRWRPSGLAGVELWWCGFADLPAAGARPGDG